MPAKESKPTPKAEIKTRWEEALDSYINSSEAASDGYSLQAVADALDTTRQRVWNQIKGRAPISFELYQHLTPLLKLNVLTEKPRRLTEAPKYADISERVREQQRQIQAKVDTGDVVRIPSVLLEDEQQQEKWAALVEHYGGKSAAVRAMIESAKLPKRKKLKP